MAKQNQNDRRLSQLIAERLVSFREEAGKSVKDIAVRSGISMSGVNKMEDPEQSNPTVESLYLYLGACGRTLFEFFDYKPWLPVLPKAHADHSLRIARRVLTGDDRKKRRGLMAMLETME